MMPTTLTHTDIDSLSKYMRFVEQQENARWYRGIGNAGYKLIPSLYRHPKSNEAAIALTREQDILRRFRERSIPYMSDSFHEDDLSILFVMQHFGFPTRLLDWTENPYIALYFALADAPYEKTSEGPKYTQDVSVWVLDPKEWNSKAFDYSDPPGIVSPFDTEALNGYLPTERLQYRRTDPIALYGVYNSTRIVAQRGVFTLFGSSTEPMERTYEAKEYPQDCLLKLNIDKANVESMLAALTDIGFVDSVVFPDLPGLAKETKRFFGFWV